MMPAWVMRIRTSLTALAARVGHYLDEHRKRDSEGWSSSLEYKRRYTNPDDAKRARTPPTPKEKS